MKNYEIRPGRPSDVEYIGPRLREADVRELQGLIDVDPLQALRDSFEMSLEVWTVVVHNKPGLMFGVGPGNVIWMLGTPVAEERYPIEFARESRRLLNMLLGKYSMLHNYTSADNEVALRWLRWLGFTVMMDAPINGMNKPEMVYYYFYKEVKDV